MGQKVLVFESDATFAADLRNELTKLGCSVQVVDDGNAGLQQATSARPDLILLYVKANLFGLIISGICCYHGLAVRRRGHDIYGMARSGMMKAFVGIFMADIVFVFIYFYIH